MLLESQFFPETASAHRLSTVVHVTPDPPPFLHDAKLVWACKGIGFAKKTPRQSKPQDTPPMTSASRVHERDITSPPSTYLRDSYRIHQDESPSETTTIAQGRVRKLAALAALPPRPANCFRITERGPPTCCRYGHSNCLRSKCQAKNLRCSVNGYRAAKARYSPRPCRHAPAPAMAQSPSEHRTRPRSVNGKRAHFLTAPHRFNTLQRPRPPESWPGTGTWRD